MRNILSTLTLAAAITLAGASADLLSSGVARAQNHSIMRCVRNTDRCVTLICDHPGSECVRGVVVTHSPYEGWRRTGYRADGEYQWYGSQLIRCDSDGDHCRLVHW